MYRPLLGIVAVAVVGLNPAWGQDPKPPTTGTLEIPASPADPGNGSAAGATELARLEDRANDLLKHQPNHPGLPALLGEVLMRATLAQRKDIHDRMLTRLQLNYPNTLQAAYFRKVMGWPALFQVFEGTIKDLENPITPDDKKRMAEAMTVMIRENGVDWSDETTLFYGVFLGFPIKDPKPIDQILLSRKTPLTKATKALGYKDSTAKDLLLDLADIPGEPKLRGIERHLFQYALNDEQRKSKLVAMALAKGFLEEWQYARARPILKALVQRTKDPQAALLHAWVLGLEGKTEEARETLEEVDSTKAGPEFPQQKELLLEAVDDTKAAAIPIRADLTRTIARMTQTLPKSFGVRLRLIDPQRGDRILLFHCDLKNDTFSLALQTEEKTLMLYRCDDNGTRMYLDADREIHASSSPGLVPTFGLQSMPWALRVWWQSKPKGTWATATSLEEMKKLPWFQPPYLADSIAKINHRLGWLALLPEETENGEILAWVRPTTQGGGMDRHEVHLDGDHRFRSWIQKGHFHLELLNCDEEPKARHVIDALWPTLPVKTWDQFPSALHLKFTTNLDEFQSYHKGRSALPMKTDPQKPAGQNPASP